MTLEHTVEITALAYGGRGVGRIAGKVVFVPYTAPGDVAQIRITAEKKGFSEGALIGLVTPSPIRQEPSCPVYGVCGGCQLQHIKYPEQVRLKQGILEETLKRLGGVSDVSYDPPMSGPDLNYRCRAHFHVKDNKWGFYEPRGHNVVDIISCPLLHERVNTAFSEIKAAFPEYPHGISDVEIGISQRDDTAVAAFHVAKDAAPLNWSKALGGVKRLKGFEVRDSETKKVIKTYGDASLEFSVFDVNMRSGIGVFSQVNRAQNLNLVEKTLLYAGLAGGERVLDLFSGAGNFSLPFARHARDVIGIEANKQAVQEAEANAAANEITNASFHAGDAALWLKRNLKTLEKNRPAVVILDPPRGGIPSSGGLSPSVRLPHSGRDADAAGVIKKLRPDKIIYVSCSPPTLARDLRGLAGVGYKVFRAGLIDMFPQTYHIECIAGLVRTA